MRAKPIKELLEQIITDRKQKLNAEIEDLRQRQHEDEFVFGMGGAYRRKEKAIECREQQIEELENTRLQLKELVQLKDVRYYKMHCRHCGNTFTSILTPSGDYHECPCCKKMIYDNAPTVYTRKATEEEAERKW